MDVIQRFLTKVHEDKNTGCWLWQASKSHQGYGFYQKTSSHRWIYQYVNQVKLTSEQFVCHTCDNPSCVNPMHLWIGTHKQNIQDMVGKKRSRFGKKNNRAKLTEQQVKRIIKSHLPVKELAIKFNVSIFTIYNILAKRNWKHV